MSSSFGQRWGKTHQGIDIPGRIGSHIVAAAEGVVVYSGDEIGGYGNITVIAHKNGFFTVYAHAKENFTRQGQRVYRGQVIAQIGMTGRTYGPHLHFEVRKNGEAIDPTNYLAAN
jgi:murein DD-endopeptidase MepM/ murein hydrolase activator NlpD